MNRTLAHPAALLAVGLSCLLLALPVGAASKVEKPAAQAASYSRQQVEVLIRAGALNLALHSIDRHQHKDDYDDAWQDWERLRYTLYFQRQQWPEIERRYAAYPKNLPDAFRNWATQQVIAARLRAGNGSGARQLLRGLIWQPGADDKTLAGLRRSVIESYLVDDRIEDAQAALARYQLDYPSGSAGWQVLRSQVLFRAGQYRDTVDVLTGMQQLDARLIRLTAGLRAGIYQPAVIIKSARRILQLRHADKRLRRQAWVLIAQAEGKRKHDAAQIAALEQALHIGDETAATDRVFALSADDLWSAYLTRAEAIGNQKRLLVGDDASWMRQAEKRQQAQEDASKKKTKTKNDKDAATGEIDARAIYAFLAARSKVDVIREIAHQRLSDSLFQKDKLGLTAVALYTQSRTLPDLEGVPDSVQYRLAIEILRAGDIKRAAGIMKALKQPPADEDVKQWKLRRARTFIYAGQFKDATKLLKEVVAENKALEDGYIRRFVQVVFDMQAIGLHDVSVELFNGLYDKTRNIEIQRELLYWVAESKSAAGDYLAAAEYYLRSAVHGQPKGGDMWGQSARYFAAEALAKAGQVADAEVVYRRLLRHATDAKRKALIERNLQQLWLQAQKTMKQ